LTKNVPVKPLFPLMAEPSDSKIGHLMEVKCGHNGRPSFDEYITMTLYMYQAGFISNDMIIKHVPTSYWPDEAF
jgi:hypothetical protein